LRRPARARPGRRPRGRPRRLHVGRAGPGGLWCRLRGRPDAGDRPGGDRQAPGRAGERAQRELAHRVVLGPRAAAGLGAGVGRGQRGVRDGGGRIAKAYELVAMRLREQILEGVLEEGRRLPKETVLADEFGVSRATIREALRLLAAHNLIRTAKGAGGGSFVTLPTADHVSEVLRENIRLLNESREVSAEDMLEARELLEAFAARMAARRRGE